MIIRKAQKKDFEQVYEIEQSCFKDPYPRKHLEYEFYENPINMILVAEDNNKIVGFNNFLITFNSASIVQVAVIPSYRKQGIATKLLSEMENSFPKDKDDVVEFQYEKTDDGSGYKMTYIRFVSHPEGDSSN